MEAAFRFILQMGMCRWHFVYTTWYMIIYQPLQEPRAQQAVHEEKGHS